MSRFLAGKPGGSVLLAVVLGLTLSACSSGAPGVGGTTPNEQIADREQQRQMTQHRTAAQNAINIAMMLVNALTANSTAAQVQAVRDAVAAANTVIAAASSLSETERNGLTGQLNAIRAKLASVTAARDAMMERRASQKTAAENTLNAAQMAVDALSDSSTDEQVMTAANAIAAANTAIAAATSLSAADMQALRNRLAMITTTRDNRLGNRQMASQRMAANDALNAANTAVDAVMNDSMDNIVEAADVAVAAAAAAVAAAGSLSAADMQTLNYRLATIRSNLASAKYRRQVAREAKEREAKEREMANQRMAARNALNAAQRAVEAVTNDSTDAQVQAADAAVVAAASSVAAATSLSSTDRQTLDFRLRTIRRNLDNAKFRRWVAKEIREIHEQSDRERKQLTAARDALNAASTAIDDLTGTSSDQDVEAAAALVNAAETAINAATSLSKGQQDVLKGSLAIIKSSLARAIEYREREKRDSERRAQRNAAEDALDVAWAVVYRLSQHARTASDQDVDAAAALVNAAETAVNAATSLSRLEQDVLQLKLDAIKSLLAEVVRFRAKLTMARTAAAGDATGAENAVMNLATLQTAELMDMHAKKHAMMARGHANMARKYANMAKDANEDARTAMTAAAAQAARRAAEAAEMKADEYRMKAREEMDKAAAAAKMELVVDGNKYSVGDSMVVDDGSSRAVELGRIYDSTDDMARLVLHDKYLGSDDIPKAMSYDHVNYGTWTDLNKVGGNDQMPASLGIGFVQKTKGGTRTGGDMPDFGSATYRGAYVANVRAAASNGKGKITSEQGGARITANFGSRRVTATLTDLATLTGRISGDGFSGTTATAHGTGIGASYTGHLPDGSSYSGAFKGHFYGPRAMEAAGVFDFTSAGAKDGEFRGAFGATIHAAR